MGYSKGAVGSEVGARSTNLQAWVAEYPSSNRAPLLHGWESTEGGRYQMSMLAWGGESAGGLG